MKLYPGEQKRKDVLNDDHFDGNDDHIDALKDKVRSLRHRLKTVATSRRRIKTKVQKAVDALLCEGKFEHLSRRSLGEQIDAAREILTEIL